MTSEETDVIISNTKRSPVEVTDWQELIRYVS
jgi:hypothetical protein